MEMFLYLIPLNFLMVKVSFLRLKGFFCILLFLCFFVFVSSIVYAEDPTPAETFRIADAEAALNTNGFDAGTAFDFGLNDVVNLFNGNLIITETDVYLPGRNGLDVAITRQYNSNIFLHVNQYGGSSSMCDKEDEVVCPDCNINANIDGWAMGGCSNQDPEKSRWIQPKLLGRGWDLDYGRLKDPTQLIYDNYYNVELGNIGGGIPGTRGFPLRGTTGFSLVMGNNEVPLFVPEKFIPTTTGSRNIPWGVDLPGHALADDFGEDPRSCLWIPSIGEFSCGTNLNKIWNHPDADGWGSSSRGVVRRRAAPGWHVPLRTWRLHPGTDRGVRG